MDAAAVRAGFLKALLIRQIAARLGDIGPQAMQLMLDHLDWVELPGGATLMKQGDPGDSMYLIVSGRLRADIVDEAGHQRLVREIARGQIVGEMSLYTDEPRSATLVAIRDTVLARLPKAAFRQLLGTSPQVSIALTRQVIEHLQNRTTRPATDRPVTIGLIPITEGIALDRFAATLAAQLRAVGSVAVIDAAALDADLDQPGIAQHAPEDVDASQRIALRLDEIEAAHDFVLLLGDSAPTQWTRCCSRQCDELYLLADAAQPPQLHPTEVQCLMNRPQRSDALEVLVLLHAADRKTPAGTAAWLGRRPIGDHLHIRPELPRDMARLARLISRTAIGLVLAGGGARGLAHLGVYRALQERGIDVDVVGGTSIGSVMATYVASDQPAGAVIDNARRAFSVNPTGDMNLIPILSLMKGLRLRRTVAQALRELVGSDGARIEDLWKTYYCVATNYSQACEHVATKGPLLEAMLASIAIPGALPPLVSDGDLLCDGGTFNNFPVDVMRRMRGVNRVIGVDVTSHKPQRVDSAELPGSWALLRDRLRPRALRRFRIPTLAAYLMSVTLLYSTSRQRQARQLTDVYLNPPLERVGMLQWKRFEQIVELGYTHGCEVLDRQSLIHGAPRALQPTDERPEEPPLRTAVVT